MSIGIEFKTSVSNTIWGPMNTGTHNHDLNTLTD